MAALQHLPALQRAVLVMRDVLAMPAAEVAVALDTSVAAANSALQRARAAMSARLPDRSQQRVLRDLGDEQVRATVAAYVAAWERADVDAVVALLAEDVVLAMPPYGEWFTGAAAVGDFFAAYPLRDGRRWTCQVGSANGSACGRGAHLGRRGRRVPGPQPHGADLRRDGRIAAMDSFLDPLLVSG